MSKIGKDHWRWSSPTSLLKQDSLEHVTQDFVTQDAPTYGERLNGNHRGSLSKKYLLPLLEELLLWLWYLWFWLSGSAPFPLPWFVYINLISGTSSANLSLDCIEVLQYVEKWGLWYVDIDRESGCLAKRLKLHWAKSESTSGANNDWDKRVLLKN